MRLIVLAILIQLLLNSFCAHSKERRLALCYGEKATQVDKKYRNAILNISHAAFTSYDKQTELKLKVRQCVKEPELSCYADTTAIFCREETISRILRVAAWLSAEAAFLSVNSSKQNAIPHQLSELSWGDALLLADAEAIEGEKIFRERAEHVLLKRSLTRDDFNSLYSLVLDIYKHTNNKINLDRNNVVLGAALDIYNQITQYAFVFVLGHESFHFNNNQCEITSKSKIEEKGLFKEVYRMQLKGGYFDPKVTLDKMEVNADLCGYRWLENLASISERSKPSSFDALTKKLAIDLLAAQFLAGYSPTFTTNNQGEPTPELQVVDGYLYPQSRLILASAVLNFSEKQYPSVVKICNNTAKSMVNLMQRAYASYSDSSGEISDDVLSQFPPGVKSAWNGGTWSDNSFNCKIGE